MELARVRQQEAATMDTNMARLRLNKILAIEELDLDSADLAQDPPRNEERLGTAIRSSIQDATVSRPGPAR